MKTIKLLLCFLAFSSVTFYSCSDSDPIENPSSAESSISLRTVINELKTANNISGRNEAAAAFCFDFVFPITFTYNTGTTVTASTFEGLIEIISNESAALYIEGVVFPFQVMQQGQVITVASEAEFAALVEACGFDNYDDDIQNTFCFDFIFPISIIDNGQTVQFNSYQEFGIYMNTPNTSETQLVFPISVIYNNETVVLHNIYEFYEMSNNCDACICNDDYNPVCVQTLNGIMEFGNMCHAECAGFTQNDLVSCGTSTDCSITGLSITPGDCNADGTYNVSIAFTATDPGNGHFTIHDSSNQLVGTYSLSQLPLTLEGLSSPNGTSNYLEISVDGTTCSIFGEFTAPNCSDCDCPTDIIPVCVQNAAGIQIQFDNECLAACAGYTTITTGPCTTFNFAESLLSGCFTMNYPVFVQYMGALVTVTSNAQLLTYTTAQGSIPPMSYPLTANFGNQTVTLHTQAEFEAHIASSCN